MLPVRVVQLASESGAEFPLRADELFVRPIDFAALKPRQRKPPPPVLLVLGFSWPHVLAPRMDLFNLAIAQLLGDDCLGLVFSI